MLTHGSDDPGVGESEAYRALFHHARAAIFLATDAAQLVDVNPAACRMLGYTREELLTHSLWDLSAAEDVAAVRRLWTGFLEAGQITGEYQMRRKDGTSVPVEFTAVANVRPGLHLTISLDVSRRRRTELELQSSQVLLQTVVNSAPIIVFALDTAGVFTLSIGKALEGLGVQPNQYVGRSVFEVYARVPEVGAQIRRALAGETFTATVDVAGRSFQAWYSPQRNRAGQVTGVLGVATDLSEHRRLEAQLLQAQKLESVGLLAGGIAHDFNNMLTAINGYADLILEDLPAGHPVREDVSGIREVADRAALLTYQLLAFGRKQILRPTALKLGDVVADLARMLRRLIGEDIRIVIGTDPDLATVNADAGQVAQVIMNLAVNARDAMPTGGTLTIETANAELDGPYTEALQPVRPGRYVLLAVSDTGTGMPPDVRLRVFEPFFTTKPVGKGTGMGLATVYGIVKQSGGYVWVYSEVGLGSTFKVYLPVADAVESTPAVPVEEARPPTGNETVLVVEDEAVVRQLVKRGLEASGYTVIEAADGVQALALCAAGTATIHLVVTDVVMPGLGGRELVARLHEKHPALRVLYMSGYTDDGVVHHGVSNEEVAFIQKPFTIRALARKVRQALDGR